MPAKHIAFIIIGAVVTAVVAVLILNLLGVQGAGAIAGGIAGGVTGAPPPGGGWSVAKKKA